MPMSHLKGLIPPMITPLTPAGEVDGAAIARHVEFLIDGGVNGLFVLGSSGEGPWLTAGQCREVVRATARTAAGRVPVLAGALEPGTERTLESARAAADNGADAVVVTTPYYFSADADMLRRHFERILDASPLPVILYNIPPMTHQVIAPATVAGLLASDRLIGIKDSAGDWNVFLALLELRQQRPGFAVLQGAERLSGQSLLAGADGLVPGMGNVAPALFALLVSQAAAGDADAVQATQTHIEALWHLHTHGFWLACLKYAVSLHGHCGPTTSGGDGLPDNAKAAIRAIVEAAPIVFNKQSKSIASNR